MHAKDLPASVGVLDPVVQGSDDLNHPITRPPGRMKLFGLTFCHPLVKEKDFVTDLEVAFTASFVMVLLLLDLSLLQLGSYFFESLVHSHD